MKHKELYKQDSTGRTRVWWIESTDTAYRTHSGLLDGKIVISGWQYPEEKNVGRSNATTISEQVLSEVESKYQYKQYQGKYSPSIEESYSGAKFMEPMLASKYDTKKTTKFPYLSQPKLDGVRCLVSEFGLQSRNGKPLLSSPHIREELDNFFEKFPDYILDGELYNHSLKDSFEQLISLIRKTKPKVEDLEESAKYVEYHIYDVITPEAMTYQERQTFIEEHIGTGFSMTKVIPATRITSKEEAENKLAEYLELGYEGQMLRDGSSPYEHKRSKHLIKHKTFEDDEFEIVDIIEGKGNWNGYAKAVEIRLANGETQQSGTRGKQDFLRELLINKDQYIGNKSQVTVRYQNKTSDGKLRFPVAIKYWKGGRNE